MFRRARWLAKPAIVTLALAGGVGGAVALQAMASPAATSAGTSTGTTSTTTSTTTTTTTTTRTTTTGTVPHVTPRARQVIKLPPRRHCVTTLKIQFARPDGVTLRRVTIVYGHHTLNRQPVPKSLKLKSLPMGKFKLKVTVITGNSHHLSLAQVYHSCS